MKHLGVFESGWVVIRGSVWAFCYLFESDRKCFGHQKKLWKVIRTVWTYCALRALCKSAWKRLGQYMGSVVVLICSLEECLQVLGIIN
jgi:hypothetical protein